MGVVQADPQELAFLIEDHCQIASPSFVALHLDGLVEDPGMTPPQGAFRHRRHPQGDALLSRGRDVPQ